MNKLVVSEVQDGAVIGPSERLRLVAKQDLPLFDTDYHLVSGNGVRYFRLHAHRTAVGIMRLFFWDLDPEWSERYKETVARLCCDDPLALVSVAGPISDVDGPNRRGISYWVTTHAGSLIVGGRVQDLQPKNVAFNIEIWMMEP